MISRVTVTILLLSQCHLSGGEKNMDARNSFSTSRYQLSNQIKKNIALFPGY